MPSPAGLKKSQRSYMSNRPQSFPVFPLNGHQDPGPSACTPQLDLFEKSFFINHWGVFISLYIFRHF